MTRPKVLIVDDEADVLKSTRMLLDRLGYDSATVQRADQVTTMAERERPDLILQDLLMPGMDIASMLRTLRKNSKTARIPIVFFSASTNLAEVAAEHDAIGFLAKPFGEEELVRILGTALGPKAAPPLAPSGKPMAAETEDASNKQNQQEAVRAYFHDYWNTLTALSNYSSYLVGAKGLQAREKDAAEEIGRLVLELERKTDALRSQLLEYVG